MSAPVAKLVCRVCGRTQSLAPADVPGGVTVEEAAGIGWSGIASEGDPYKPGTVVSGFCPFEVVQ